MIINIMRVRPTVFVSQLYYLKSKCVRRISAQSAYSEEDVDEVVKFLNEFAKLGKSSVNFKRGYLEFHINCYNIFVSIPRPT